MPVYSRRFFHAGTNDPAPEHLRDVGPREPVEIHIPDALARNLVQAGQPIPPPQTGYALFDTGASVTAVDENILQALGLNPIGQTQVIMPDGKVHTCPQYPARIVFPGTRLPNLVFQKAVGTPLQNQGYLALIGRDIMMDWVIVYNGPGAHVTFAW